MTAIRPRRIPCALLLLSLLAAVAGCSEDRSAPTDRAGSVDEEVAADATCGDDLLACAADTTIADLVPDAPTAAEGEPLVIGMMNTEDSPAGSYTELSRAVQAAAAFVDEQLGGVDGRPVEVEVCDTGFSAEGSTACAQRLVERGVAAVLGGIDVFGTGIETLEANGIPYVGGIPISDLSMTSPTSFQWSGGTWAAAIAFADHAVREVGAERVGIVYGDFGPIADAAERARAVLEAAGVEVALVPSPVLATDLGAPVQAAAAGDPDAVAVLTADTGCALAFDAVATLRLDAQMYYTGACAAPDLLDAAPPEAVDGALFNVEGLVDPDRPDPDLVLYAAVVEAYGDGLDPVGAGTVSFRSFVNLYRVLRQVDDPGDPEAITAALREAVDVPSFMGHPYTCDGRQLDGLPSACSPQQALVRLVDGELLPEGGWIDVGAVERDA